MYPRVVQYLLPTLAVTLIASAAGAQTDIDVSARLSATVPAYGNGFCAQFSKGDGANEVGSTAAALNLLDDESGAPDRSDPDRTFFDIVPLADLHDGADGSTGRQLSYNAFFPWSWPSNVWTTETCQSHGGGAVGANRFAMRLRADLLVPSAGTYTLAMRSDDGYRVSVGGVAVMETGGLRSAATDTRRVRFAEAGTYAIEVVYFENDGHAVFEMFVANSDITFVSDSDNAAVATSGGFDLSNRNYDVLPAAFTVVSSAHVTLPTWLGAGDDDCSAYVNQPSSICTMPAASGVSCGNGRIDAYSDGGAEACDDGNKVDGDGCSATCTIEAGWVCARAPSLCGTDLDGDGIPDRDDTNNDDGPNGDVDGDGIPNADDDDDTDGPLGDIDGDGIPNSLDDDNTDGPLGDVDGDGIPNGEDPNSTDGPNGDLDNDGTPNGVDPTPDGEVPGGGDTETGGDNGGNTGGDNGGTTGGTDNGNGTGSNDNGEGEPAAQNPGDDANADELTDDSRFGLSGSGCAATSPSGLTPFGVLAMGLFMARKRRD